MSARYFGGRRTPEFHPIVRVGSGLIITGLLLEACIPERQTPTQADIFPTQPRSTEVFTPTPEFAEEDAGVLRSSQEIQETVGRIVGAGGPVFVDVERVGQDFLQGRQTYDILKQSLNRNGLGIYHSDRVVAQIGELGDGTRVCFPVMPPHLFNPSVATGQDDWIREEQFVISYGDDTTETARFQAISAISLEQSASDLVCVNGFVNLDNNLYGATQGTLFTLLMDWKTGDIYGEIPTVYSPEDRVEVQVEPSTGNLQIVVNGRASWFTGERMAQLTPTPDPVEVAVSIPEIVSVEEWNGMWIGLDVADRTIMRFENVKWVDVQRETGIACFERFDPAHCEGYSPEMLEPLPAERIRRLYDAEGNSAPWGLHHVFTWESDVKHNFVSGIIRGGFHDNDVGFILVQEVPLKTGDSQYFFWYVTDVGAKAWNTYGVMNRNIEERIPYYATDRDIAQIFLDPANEGEQVLVILVSGYRPDNPASEWNPQYRELVRALENNELNESTDVPVFTFGHWIDLTLLQK